MFRFLVTFFIAFFAMIALRLLLSPRRSRRHRGGSGAGDAGDDRYPQAGNRGALVKDPQCGLLLDPTIARQARVGGQTLHFCSEECLNAYRQEHGE